ncbi:MAG: hypothetical protein ABI811_11325 [Acidobacteriota bacterium]
MIIHRLHTALLFAGLMGASLLGAHDAKLHKGTATTGEIVSVTAANAVMKTAKGNVTVTFSKDTKFEMGTQAVDLNHFKKGDKISVFGTKLANGEMSAKEVVMTVTPAKAASPTKGDHKH